MKLQLIIYSYFRTANKMHEISHELFKIMYSNLRTTALAKMELPWIGDMISLLCPRCPVDIIKLRPLIFF